MFGILVHLAMDCNLKILNLEIVAMVVLTVPQLQISVLQQNHVVSPVSLIIAKPMKALGVVLKDTKFVVLENNV
jgi:hypothetical protein